MSETTSIDSSLSEAPINIVVIGGGTHGMGSHVEAIRKSPDFNLVAIADTSEQRRRKLLQFDFVQENGINITGSPKEAMNLPGLDAVIIASPDRFHYSQTSYALMQAQKGKGLHILTDKPLTNAVDEIRPTLKLFSAAQEKGKILLPCFPRRFGQPWETIHQMVHTPGFLEQEFGTDFGIADMGAMRNITLDAHYTEGDPDKHISLAIDKDPHNANTAAELTRAVRFEDIFMRRLKEPKIEFQIESTAVAEDGHRVAITSRGSRKIPGIPDPDRPGKFKDNIYRDSIIIGFDRGMLIADSLGMLTIKCLGETVHGDNPERYRTDYDQQFAKLHQHFADLVLGRTDVPLISATSTALATMHPIVAEAESYHSDADPKAEEQNIIHRNR